MAFYATTCMALVRLTFLFFWVCVDSPAVKSIGMNSNCLKTTDVTDFNNIIYISVIKGSGHSW